MTDTTNSPRTILVLGGTGKTGRRVARLLADAGVDVRTAARSGGDVTFDWDDPSTHGTALAGASAVYLVPPALSITFAPLVAKFLDQAEVAGVRHVTYLSARGVDQAPPEQAMRAVELDLAARPGLTHSVVRPSWFMQNFSESFFQPGILAGLLPLPAGSGAEAFIHADDIAEVAAATLLDPAAHAGAGYTLTGAEALTFAEVAERIGTAAGRPVTYVDADRSEWIATSIANGLPDYYAELLAGLFDIIRDGFGAGTTGDVEAVTGHAPRTFADYLADPATLAAW